jgi:putative DNA primase/helicase
MCGYDAKLAHHMFCWLAWPLKYPGTKMGYSIVVHGGQGTGKSLFFERLMMQIYGLQYSIQIGQTELESHYTGWLSQKLFVVCNEVSSSAAERKLSKNRLKSVITDKWFSIEEKYMPVRTEENHANLVFLSNEHQPVLPDMDDRRYEIVRFDSRMDADYYVNLAAEIENGGAEAFYDFLLKYDTKDYMGAAEKPHITAAKEVLVSSSRTPHEQFLYEWKAGLTQFPYVSCAVDDFWNAYKIWCKEGGYFIGTKNGLGRTLSNHPMAKEVEQGMAIIDGNQTRIRLLKKGISDLSVQEQIKLFREAYNEAYINYNTRIKL